MHDKEEEGRVSGRFQIYTFAVSDVEMDVWRWINSHKETSGMHAT
jgi:hypothetical protein